MGDVQIETRAPRKARAILNNLIQTRQLTPSGLRWLEIATDPFHDTEVRPDGYPDMVATRSIVQVVTKTTSISWPTSTSYDCHVFFAPLTPSFLQTTPVPLPPVPPEYDEDDMFEYGMDNEGKFVKLKEPISSKTVEKIVEKQSNSSNVEVTTPASAQAYYCHSVDSSGGCVFQSGITPIHPGWNVITTSSGGNWQTSAHNDFSALQLPQEYSGGAWRLIGTGLEVVNTSAPLIKGGSVTCYRSPSPAGESQLYFNTGTSEDPFRVTNMTRLAVMPPALEAEAALYPNSRTWGAEEGVYLIATMNSSDNPYYVPKPHAAGLMIPRAYSDLNLGNGWLAWLPTANALGIQYDPMTSLTNTLPFDISGAIFSGLNYQSTLQVTVRYYIERNPTIADPNLLVLARTPCPFDPVALEIYTRCMEELPVGVPVRMNPLGEWFTEVLQGIGEWAPKIGTAVGNIIPGAQAIGNIVGTAAKGIQLARGTKVVEKIKPSGAVTVTATKTRKRKKPYKQNLANVFVRPPIPPGFGVPRPRRKKRVRVRKAT